MAILSDEFYYQHINLDTVNTQVFTNLTSKVGDTNGRGLIVTLTENGLQKDTTGISLNLKWKHRSVVGQGLDNFDVVDLSKGVYKITYPTEMNLSGLVDAFVQIVDSGKVVGTRNMIISVESTVGDDSAIESSNSFSALASALIEVQSWNDRIDVVEQDFIDRANNLDATYPTRLVSVETQLADINKVFVNASHPPSPLIAPMFDGATDDTAKIQSIINSIATSGGRIKFPSSKRVCISSTIIVPHLVDIDFNNCTFVPIVGGTFINNFMFTINSSNGVGWDVAYPIRVGYFKNINLDNRNTETATPRLSNVKGILTGSPHKISNVYAQFLWQTCTTTADYIDNLEWESFMIVNPQGSNYQVVKVGQGDRCKISKMDLINYLENGVTNKYGYLLRVSNTMGCLIDGIVNGINTVLNSAAVTLNNLHCERGFWKIQDSGVSIRDSYFWKDDINSAITVLDTECQTGIKWGTAKPTMLDNVVFNLRFNDYPYINNIPDIDTTYFRGVLKIKGCYRRSEPLSMPYNRLPISGVSVKTPGGVINVPFNDNNIVDGTLEKITISGVTEVGDDGYYLVTGLSTQTGIEWLDAIGTYQYRAGVLFDLSRMIGVINSATGSPSITLTDATKAVKLTLGKFRGNGIMRIFRGGTSGQYDKFVDVPNVVASMLFDNGKNVQGHAWQNRVVGGIDSVNVYTGLHYVGINIICYGANTPTVGTWKKGDRVLNASPVVGQPKSWVCTVAGTPGTWVSEGVL